jgi:hypothetical protein
VGVRRESVVLSLEDNGFTSKMAKDAAVTAILVRELDRLDGTSVKANRSTTALGGPGGGIDKTGSQARKASGDLNQYTGRLSLLATAATTLGPALLPIGAVAVPAVTALAGGLGATVGAVGTAVLAFHGLGDALKAVDAYQLEPTAANLEKVRKTLGQLSPAAQDFVMRLDQLEPSLNRLRTIAQEGLLPGVGEGLDEVMTLLPDVETVIDRISHELGHLASDAGASLASDGDWQAFFEYVKEDAAPILDDFARATGNVAAGLGSILVAFRPLSKDFSDGLLDMSRSFREWAAGLSESDGFREFVDYIRENGPAVGEFFIATAEALGGLVQAAAPWGAAVLPILTEAAKVFGAIASSPVGPVIYDAAAAMLLFNRSSALLATTLPKLRAGMAGFSASLGTIAGVGGLVALTDSGKRAGSALGALESAAGGAALGFSVGGPFGAAIGGTAGALLDMKQAADDATGAIERLDDATFSHDREQLVDAISAANDKLNNLNWVDHMIGADDALRASLKSAQDELAALDAAGGHTGDVADLLGETINLTGQKFKIAAGDVGALSGALGDLNGWLDKRDALRNYQAAIDGFTASLKTNGNTFDIATEKGRANQQALDQIATSVAQVANQIKNPAARQNFVKSAISDLRSMANDASPQAAAAIRGVIRKLKDLDATPAKPKVTVDTKQAQTGINDIMSLMGRVNGMHASTSVTLKTIYTSVGKPTSKTDPTLGGLVPGHATGGWTGPGNKYDPAGVVHRDEVVIPKELVHRDARFLKQRYGFLPGMDSLPGYAGGGRVGAVRVADSYGVDIDRDDGLKKRLRLFGKALDEAKKALDAETSARDSLVGSITSNLTGDPFGSSSSGAFSSQFAAGSIGAVNATLKQQIATANEQAQLQKILAARGVSGAALQEVIEKGGINGLRSFANASDADLAAYQSLYGQRADAVRGAANGAAEAVGMTAELVGLRGDVKILTNAVRQTKQQGAHQHAEAQQVRRNQGRQTAAALNHSAGRARSRRR